MADPLHYNLFRFAPKELSHSAFWAWMMQSIEAEQVSAMHGPRSVAIALLKRHGVPPLRPPIIVETEWWLTKRDRLDIRVTDARGTIVVIENKVLATPDARQVKRYQAGLGVDAKAHLLILSTAFDDDVRGTLGCEYVGVDELFTLIRPCRSSHFILGEYFGWLQALRSRRKRLSRQAHAGEPDVRDDALGTAEGQWVLMTTLTGSMLGRQYRGVGLSGDRWTQFSFVEQSSRHDAIFYRIDRSSDGYQLQLKQYRDDVSGKNDAGPKMDRLALLRLWWREVCKRHGPGLRIADFSERGTKASVIGRLLLHENPPRELAKVLPAIHRAFVRKLLREGWPVTTMK